MTDLIPSLRLATEDDVMEAIESGEVEIDASPMELLNFFNAMLDVLAIPDLYGDIAARTH